MKTSLLTRAGQWLLVSPLRSGLAALAFALMPLLGVPLGWVSAVIIAYITLQRGPQVGLGVLAWALLPGLALAVLHDPNYFYWVVGTSVLGWLFAVILDRTRSWTLVIEVGALLAVVVILTLYATTDISESWRQFITEYLKEMVKQESPNLSAANVEPLTGMLTHLGLGFLAFFALMNAWVNVLFARWWQSVSVEGLRISQELRALSASRFTAGLAVLVTALTWFFPPMLMLLPLALLPVGLAGLSVAHVWISSRSRRVLGFVALYVGLLLLFPYSAMLLALVGMLDCWYDFRKKRVV